MKHDFLKKNWAYPIILFFFSFIIRAYSAHHGAPYCYHNDEHWMFEPAFNMVTNHSWKLEWFRIPPLLILAYRIQLTALQWILPIDLTLPSESWFAPHDILPTQFPMLYAGRLMIACFGAATVSLMYLIIKRYASAGWAVFFSMLYSIASINIFYSSYLRAEPLVVFFLVFSTYGLLRYTDAFEKKWLYVSGIMFGFAYASKYNAVFFVLSGVLYLFLVNRKHKHAWWDCFLFLITSGVTFIVTTPHLIWKSSKIAGDIVGNYVTYRSGELGNEGSFLDNIDYYFRTCMMAADKFGIFLLIFCGSILFFAVLWKKIQEKFKPLFAMSAFFCISYTLFLAQFRYQGERNLIFIYPFVFFCCAFAVITIVQISLKYTKEIIWVVVGIGACVMMYHSYIYLKKCNQPLPQDHAISWINAHAVENAVILREMDSPLINPQKFSVLHTFYISTIKPESILKLNPNYLIMTKFVRTISEDFNHTYPKEFNAWIWAQTPEFEDANKNRIPLGTHIKIYDFQKIKQQYIETFGKYIANPEK